mmetsp:Transcript_106533/g.306334  ORF Transcript_106533/g.306334 Transcript_106533/m.306334 type:complete len:250 (+) Transcript_106533:840-1589(+)
MHGVHRHERSLHRLHDRPRDAAPRGGADEDNALHRVGLHAVLRHGVGAEIDRPPHVLFHQCGVALELVRPCSGHDLHLRVLVVHVAARDQWYHEHHLHEVAARLQGREGLADFPLRALPRGAEDDDRLRRGIRCQLVLVPRLHRFRAVHLRAAARPRLEQCLGGGRRERRPPAGHGRDLQVLRHDDEGHADLADVHHGRCGLAGCLRIGQVHGRFSASCVHLVPPLLRHRGLEHHHESVHREGAQAGTA